MYLGASEVLCNHKMRYFNGKQEKRPLFVGRWDRKICSSGSPFVITQDHNLSSLGRLVIPISNPQDGFFYSTVTLMIDSYKLTLVF